LSVCPERSLSLRCVATPKKIKGLSDREIGSLFTLEEFVQTGAYASA